MKNLKYEMNWSFYRFVAFNQNLAHAKKIRYENCQFVKTKCNVRMRVGITFSGKYMILNNSCRHTRKVYDVASNEMV